MCEGAIIGLFLGWQMNQNIAPITKVLANRLQPLLPTLIGSNQSALDSKELP